MSGVVGGFDGLRYASPILRELAHAIKKWAGLIEALLA